MSKKQDHVQEYIRNLTPGQQISVRQLAQLLHVSEGVAYRGIQKAKEEGIVSTIPRVGTVRISNESFKKELHYADIVKMIDGVVYSGKDYLEKPLEYFMIGAMEEETMKKFMKPHALMIVGNREYIQLESLKQGMAVLITGGFPPSEGIKAASEYYQFPVIGTNYDTFTVATMINKALGEQKLMQSIIQVKDVKIPVQQTITLEKENTVADYEKICQNQKVIPIVDAQKRVEGLVSEREVKGKPRNTPLGKIMQTKIVFVRNHSNVASVAHLLLWDEFSYLPVVKENGVIDGLVSKEMMLEGIEKRKQNQHLKQKTIFDTLHTILEERITVDGHLRFAAKVHPGMIHSDGTLAESVLTELIVAVAKRKAQEEYIAHDLQLEELNVHFFKAIPVAAEIELEAKILGIQQNFIKMEVEIYHSKEVVTKAYFVAHIV